MTTRTEKTFEEQEAELYLALKQVLRKMSQSTSPQQKLANQLGTLLANHHEEYGRVQETPPGEVEIVFKEKNLDG